MVREHPHHFVRHAARRERQAWAYLSFTAVMILIIAIAFSLVDMVMANIALRLPLAAL